MDHIPRGKIVAGRQHRYGCWLLIIRAVLRPQRHHLSGAFQTELDARIGVYTVVDAVVHRLKTSQHRGIGGVHNGVRRKTGDVALPNGEALFYRDRFHRYHTLLRRQLRQILVLDAERLLVHRPRHADIHEASQRNTLFLIRPSQIHTPVSLCFRGKPPGEKIQSFGLIHLSPLLPITSIADIPRLSVHPVLTFRFAALIIRKTDDYDKKASKGLADAFQFDQAALVHLLHSLNRVRHGSRNCSVNSFCHIYLFSR